VNSRHELVPLVALFAVLLALLDCEREDWNAARRLLAARQMIEAGGLGEYWNDRRS